MTSAWPMINSKIYFDVFLGTGPGDACARDDGSQSACAQEYTLPLRLALYISSGVVVSVR